MKKITKATLLTVTALSMACFGGQSLTAQAAPQKRIFITYSSDCNLQGILDKLQNCFPNITLPDSCPDNNQPDNNQPDNNAPEDTTPDIAPDNTPETDSSTDEHSFLQEVVDLVNEERSKEGLSPLTIDTKVQAAALVRAKECETLFSHTRPNGTSFATALSEQNVSYRNAGENIAWGQKSPAEVMKAWMNSSGHRANIMNPNFTTIGVGYYENANGTDYWCQLFTR